MRWRPEGRHVGAVAADVGVAVAARRAPDSHTIWINRTGAPPERLPYGPAVEVESLAAIADVVAKIVMGHDPDPQSLRHALPPSRVALRRVRAEAVATGGKGVRYIRFV